MVSLKMMKKFEIIWEEKKAGLNGIIELEDKSEMSVSLEHEVYAGYSEKNQNSLISNPSSSITNNLPLNSFTSDKRDDKAATSLSAFGGCITKTIMPEYSLGGNKEVLRKSESREIIAASSFLAKEANLSSDIPLDTYSALNPLDLSSFLTDLGMFSSSRNFEFNIVSSSDKVSSVVQGAADHFSSKGRVFFKEFINAFSGSEQFNNITYQNSSAFESWLAMTNLTVCYNIFVDFNSHKINDNEDIFKDFGLILIKERKGHD